MSTATTTVPHVFSFYGYQVNLVLPIVVAVLFALVGFYHTYVMIRRRSFYMWPFVLAVYMEAAGYVLRRISGVHVASRNDGLKWYLMTSLCIILAPALMAATHYMIFGRLITYVGESFSPVRARRVTLIFVVFDVLSFLVQGGGGSIYASDNPNLYTVAKTVLVIGFLIQIISFGIFGVFAGIYQIRARRAGVQPGGWTKCLYTLYLGCALILTRSIFRTLEFGTAVSQHGVLIDSEALYYCLEALPILITSYLFAYSHPTKYFPVDRSARLHGVGEGIDVAGADKEMAMVDSESMRPISDGRLASAKV